MARKRKEGLSDGNMDSFVAWEVMQRQRRDIDSEVASRIVQFERQLTRWEPKALLRFAARCVLRVRGVPLPKTEAARIAQDFVDEAAWIAINVLKGEGESSDRFIEAMTGVREALYPKEWTLYKGDQDSYAILDLTRMGARLMECAKSYYESNNREMIRRAASIAAHTASVVEWSDAHEEQDRLEGAIQNDLRRPSQDDGLIESLWTSETPKWFKNANRSRNLDKIGDRVIMTYLNQHFKLQNCNNIHVDKDINSTNAKLSEVAAAEKRFALLQKQQVESLQRLMESLKGHSLGSFELNRELAARVMSMVSNAGCILFMSGEFIDARGRTKVYTRVPVTIKCEHPESTSFHIRSADSKFKYITALPNWPYFHVVPKDSLTNLAPSLES
jgi:hypothetical protein